MSRLKFLFSMSLLATTFALLWSGVVRADTNDAESIRALRDYVDAFDQYETDLANKNRSAAQDAWSTLKSERNKQLRASADQELEQIETAIRSYEKAIADSSGSPDEPFALFNLARSHFLKGQREKSAEISTGSNSFAKASDFLGEIVKKHKSFEKIDLVYYLNALSLEALGRSDDAASIWKSLSRMSAHSIYASHANITLGDQEFRKNNPVEAIKYFQSASKLLPKLTDDTTEYERARIAYRIMWASFKSANTALALKSAQDVLLNKMIARKITHARKITQDAVEVMGDSLYVQNDASEIKRVLVNRALVAHAGPIGLRVIQLYSANNRDLESIRTGEVVLQNFPLDSVVPRVLDLMALGYERLGKVSQRIGLLEKLALLLPKDSLWRTKNSGDFESLLNLDQKAEGAARIVAAHYYDQGLASGNRNDFDASAAYFRLLLNEKPNGPESLKWRLKEAHCYYFTGMYDEADKIYLGIKADLQVDPETLEVAAYQLVMTRERRWREVYGKSTEQSKSPQNDPEVISATSALEKAIDEFADRFPDKTRTVDILLVAASANRDLQRFSNASRYWQRALVSRPTPQQRGIAIRGILYVSLQSADYREAVHLASQFLKLEDWKALGTPLRNEVIGILSAASRDEGKRLNDSGKLHDAGALLSSVARQFTDIPNREKSLRDGAFMLAVAGDWNSVHSITSTYVSEKLRVYADEMNYLLARSLEYQMRFKEAAAQYLTTGRTFPKYKRADFCLSRAELLGVGNDDYETAGQAALTLGNRSNNNVQKLAHFKRSTEYFLQAERADLANRSAGERVRASKSPKDLLTSRLIAAKARYQSGDEVKALEELRELAAQIERSKPRLGDAYSALAAQTNFLLAEDDRLQFEDFNIFERGGNPITNINQKAKYFETLARNLDKVARQEVPEWSSQARYNLASAAEQFSQDVLAAKTRSGESLPGKTQEKLDETAKRLQRMAKRYFGENLMARNKNPASYRDNPWVKKSTFRLSAYQKLDEKPQFEEELQASLRLDIPQNWSL